MDLSPTVPPMAQSYSPGQAMYPPTYPPVVTQQPAPQQQVVVQQAQRDWSSELYDCTEDYGSSKYSLSGTQMS